MLKKLVKILTASHHFLFKKAKSKVFSTFDLASYFFS